MNLDMFFPHSLPKEGGNILPPISPQLHISLIKIITDWGNFPYPNFWTFLYKQWQQLKIQKIVDHKLNTQTEKHRRINPKNFKYTMKIKFKYTSTWYTDLVADEDIDNLYRRGS